MRASDYSIDAELTWTGHSFERNIRVCVGKDGKIIKVLRKGEDEGEDATHTEIYEAIGHALIPGMVNAHSHAFQRGLRGKGETYPNPSDLSSSFWTWRDEMYGLVENMTEEQFYLLCKQCYDEMRQSGITTVGEFHYFHHGLTKPRDYCYDRTLLKAAKDAGIRIVLLNAFYAHGGFHNAPMNASQSRFQTTTVSEYWNNMDQLALEINSCQTQTLGVVAHSLRAVDVESFVKLHQESVVRKLVFHMHIEEQPKEVADCQAALGSTPMGIVLKLLNVDSKFTAVHCTWSDDAELKAFVDKGGHVCLCPLTEGNLGDGFAPLSSCGSSICLGSDCNERIDMLEEMRWLEYAQRLYHNRRGVIASTTNTPNLSSTLFEFATVNGGKSLNLPIGRLEADYFADMALIDLNQPCLTGWSLDGLLTSIVFGSAGSSVVVATSVHGKWTSTNPLILKQNVDHINILTKEIERAAGMADGLSNDVVELACYLINTQSLSGHETPMAKAVESWLVSRGWHVQLQQVLPQKDCVDSTLRYNVFATQPGVESPNLLFNSHIDTVPPYFPARIDATNLYGRGACDTKSLLAAQMIAAQQLVEEGLTDIGILYVVSEETDHSGMIAANELNLSPKFMIVAEPTDMKLMRLQKGILKLKLIYKGMAAHSGYPSLGNSAIDPLIDVLFDLKHENWPKSDELGDTTLNIGMIKGGQAANALAEFAEALLMFRVTHDPQELYNRVVSIVNGRVEVELLSMNAPVTLGQLDTLESDVASFNTDIPYFKFNGTAYLIGPGNITDAHCSREFIPLSQLRESVDVYKSMARQLMN